MLHIPPTNCLLLTAKQEPYKKACLLMKYIEENDKTERVTGLGRRTREEIAKWNQLTALRFPTGGRTSDIPGLPSGGFKTSCNTERSLMTRNVSCNKMRQITIHFVISAAV